MITVLEKLEAALFLPPVKSGSLWRETHFPFPLFHSLWLLLPFPVGGSSQLALLAFVGLVIEKSLCMRHSVR